MAKEACRALRAEINFLYNVHNSIRTLLEDTTGLKSSNPTNPEWLGDPTYRKLLAEKNAIFFKNEGIAALLGSTSLPIQDLEEPNKFSPLLCSSPHAKKSTHLPEETDDSYKFEAGQRFECGQDEENGHQNVSGSSGSTTFFEMEAEPAIPVEPLKEDSPMGLNVPSKRVSFSTSYDRLPIKENPPQKKIRGKARKQLPGYACDQCEKFYEAAQISQTTLQSCTRHRGQKPPPTPKNFWRIGWVPTQEMEEAKEEARKEKAARKEKTHKRKLSYE